MSTMSVPDLSAISQDPPPHPLDQVIWEALTTAHGAMAEGNERARRYPPRVAPFAAMPDGSPASFEALERLVPSGDRVALLATRELTPSSGFQVAHRACVDQMLLTGTPAAPEHASLAALGPTHVLDMMALATLTHPGPFSAGTHELGGFLGVWCQDQLVAMAGERMRLTGFTEISAVCVHPNHRGRGHAAALVAAVARTIVDRGETPFLHVLCENAGAIALYRKLGFTRRRTLHFTVIQRD